MWVALGDPLAITYTLKSSKTSNKEEFDWMLSSQSHRNEMRSRAEEN